MRNGDALNLPDQQDWLIELMVRCPNLRIIPDGQGIGAQIAQALVKQFGPKRVLIMIPGSKPKGFPPQDKAEMITDLKRALEAEELRLMPDREQATQFHRTKKRAGKFVQAGSTKRSHFDRFWATAYAQYGISSGGALESAYSRHGLRVIDMTGSTSAA
jgi:phage FluMu gp28-like protein